MSPQSKGPVLAVHAIATGHAQQHPEHRYGTRKPTLLWVLTSRRWVPVPIYCFAIEHAQGLVLFDTGLSPAIATDPNYIDSRLGRFLLKRIFRLSIGPEDGLDQQLPRLGVSAGDVRYAILSHLHFDHVGGIEHIPQAQLLLSQTEYDRLSQPHPERDWILAEHIQRPEAKLAPFAFQPVDDPLLQPFGGAFDVMGDGSLVILPTPGHTAGSTSLLIRSAGMPPTLLVGDLAYELDGLLHDRLPGVGDRGRLRASYAKVRALRQALPDLRILPAHDPAVPGVLAHEVHASSVERVG